MLSNCLVNGQDWHSIIYPSRGNRHGLSMFWYDNGQKKDEGNYKWGERHGLWIFYNDDGTEDYHVTYKDGKYVED